jgi:hypothetical protein
VAREAQVIREEESLHQGVRSKNRRMEALSPEVPRVNLPTVFSADTLTRGFPERITIPASPEPTWIAGRGRLEGRGPSDRPAFAAEGLYGEISP